VYVIGHWYYEVCVEETRKELSYLRTMGTVTSEGNFNKKLLECWQMRLQDSRPYETWEP